MHRRKDFYNYIDVHSLERSCTDFLLKWYQHTFQLPRNSESIQVSAVERTLHSIKCNKINLNLRNKITSPSQAY